MTYEQIHEEIKREFKELTGKDNYKIYANKYFIPRFAVFKIRLDHAVKKYKLDDLEKVRNVLLSYTRECIKNKFPKYTRTIEYYIFGQNGKDCRLADDYENYGIEVLKEEDVQKIGVSKNKDLFG